MSALESHLETRELEKHHGHVKDNIFFKYQSHQKEPKELLTKHTSTSFHEVSDRNKRFSYSKSLLLSALSANIPVLCPSRTPTISRADEFANEWSKVVGIATSSQEP